MKIIVCTGDSHTCGEGADGFDAELERTLGFNRLGKGIEIISELSIDSYVNKLRRSFIDRGLMKLHETFRDELSALGSLPKEACCIRLDRALEFPCDSELALLLFAEKKEPADADIYVDGRLYRSLHLEVDITRYGEWSFRFVPVSCGGAEKITVKPVSGRVYLSRIEEFSGDYAIINNGIGNCTVGRYNAECFDCCVGDFAPDLVIAEAHTINDWLNRETPDEYRELLEGYLNRIKAAGTEVLMTTVAPVLGEQSEPKNPSEYREFVEASRTAAKNAGVPWVDANKAITEALATVSEAEMFADIYHVKSVGHGIYAELIFDKLCEMLGITK